MEQTGKPKEDNSSDNDVEEEGEGDQIVRDEQDTRSRYVALRHHRISFEAAIDPNAQRITELRRNDILLGRGKSLQQYPGNIRMREITERHKEHYHNLKREEKSILMETVYNELIEGGTRFLKKLENENVWVKVDGPIALQKVGHALRCRKKEQRRLMAEEARLSSSNTEERSPAPRQALNSNEVSPSTASDALAALTDRASLRWHFGRPISRTSGIIQPVNPLISHELSSPLIGELRGNSGIVLQGLGLNPALNVALLSQPNSIVEQQALRLAALTNSEYGGLGMTSSVLSSIASDHPSATEDQLSSLRGRQAQLLLRERLLLGQLGNANMLPSGLGTIPTDASNVLGNSANGTEFQLPVGESTMPFIGRAGHQEWGEGKEDTEDRK